MKEKTSFSVDELPGFTGPMKSRMMRPPSVAAT